MRQRMRIALLMLLFAALSVLRSQEPLPGNENRLEDTRLLPERLFSERVESGRISAQQAERQQIRRQVLDLDLPFYARYGSRFYTPRDANLSGLRFGAVTLFPSANVDARYTEDAFAGREDLILSYSPAMRLIYSPARDFSIETGYGFVWNDYVKDEVRDHLEHSADIAINIRNAGIRNLNFTIFDNYFQTGNVGRQEQDIRFVIDEDGFQSFFLRDIFDAFSRVQNNVSGVTTQYRAGGIVSSSTYSYEFVDYFGRADEAQQTRTHRAVTRLSFNYHRQFSPYLSYSFDRRIPEIAGRDGSDQHAFSMGTGIGIRRNLSASFGISPRVVFDHDSGLRTQDLTFSGALNWVLFKRYQLGFTGDAGLFDREQGVSSRLLGCGVSFNVSVYRSLNVGMYASFKNTETALGDRTQTNLYGMQAGYRIQRHLRCYLRFNRSDDWFSAPAQPEVRHNSLNTGNFGFSANF